MVRAWAVPAAWAHLWSVAWWLWPGPLGGQGAARVTGVEKLASFCPDWKVLSWTTRAANDAAWLQGQLEALKRMPGVARLLLRHRPMGGRPGRRA